MIENAQSAGSHTVYDTGAVTYYNVRYASYLSAKHIIPYKALFIHVLCRHQWLVNTKFINRTPKAHPDSPAERDLFGPA
jgi:hypothetical protein